MSKSVYNELEQIEICKMYFNDGLTVPEIRDKKGTKNHQPIYNILKKHPKYKPFLNGRGENRKYTLNEEFFDTINTQEKAYILGFICADGHIADNRIVISLARKDEELLIKIAEKMNSNSPIRQHTQKSSFGYGRPEFEMSTIYFNSVKLCDALRLKGLLRNKTYTLDGNIIKTIPKYLLRHFVRGYFDGDGNIYISVKKWKYLITIVGNQDFLEKMLSTYKTGSKMAFHTKSKQTWIWRIANKNLMLKFCKKIYKDSTIHLDRKFETYDNYRKLLKTEIQEQLSLL